MKTFILAVILIFVPLSASARHFSGVAVEGVDARQGKIVRDIIQAHLKSNADLDDVQAVLGLIYDTGLFNDIAVYYDDHDGGTEVIFKLSPIRRIHKIRFVGNDFVSSSDLLSELGFGENEGYSEEKVRAGIENIKKFYNLSGFLNAKVSAEFLKAEGSDLTLEVLITEGEPCRIGQISFRSVNTSMNSSLEKDFSWALKRNFSQALLSRLQDDINHQLLDEHYYSASVLPPETLYNPAKTSVSLIYVINDPYAFALAFEGRGICEDPRTPRDQPCFNNSDITRELKLDPQNRLSNSPLEDLIERLLRFYRRKGFAHVGVTYRENLFTKDYVRRITFMVDSGAKVKIKDVFFDGSFSRPRDYYANLFFDKASDLTSSKLYVNDDIDTAVKNVVIELQNQGFIAAKVSGVRTDFDKNGENAVIRVTIDEGPQTFIDKINFKGVRAIKSFELEKAIGLKAGTPLHLGLLEDSVARITDLYHSRGYLDAQVINSGKGIISYNADNTKATLTFDIAEGPQITVSSVIIEGNATTKEYVIRRELQFNPGDVLTPDKIAYTEQRLQRLSLFSTVDIRPLEDDPNLGNRTVLVRVVESNPGIFKSGVGVNNDFDLTIKGYVGAAYRNLFGTGRSINARVEIADKARYSFIENEVNLGYTEPFVFNTANTGRINLTRSTKLFWKDTSTGYTYALDTSQADFLLERDITPQLKLVYDVYGVAHVNQFEINNQVGSTPLNVASTGPTLLLDRRDDVFNPTQGDLTSLSFQFSNPRMGSTQTVSYYKATASYARYVPMGRVVWANEFKGGYLKNLSTLSDGTVPWFELFSLGGQSSLRAFNPLTELVPLQGQLDVPSPPYPYPGTRTEMSFELVKSEIRFPILGNFGGVLFYDGGRVDFPGFTTELPWRDDAGFGFRYITPVGPVSLEYAQKLNHVDRHFYYNQALQTVEESYFQILFSIGVF